MACWNPRMAVRWKALVVSIILIMCSTQYIHAAKKKRKTSATPLTNVDEQQGIAGAGRHHRREHVSQKPQDRKAIACGTWTSYQKAPPPRASLRCRRRALITQQPMTCTPTAPCRLPRKHHAQSICGADTGICDTGTPLVYMLLQPSSYAPLGYQWNRRGYDIAVKFGCKLEFVSPVWFVVRAMQAACTCSNTLMADSMGG